MENSSLLFNLLLPFGGINIVLIALFTWLGKRWLNTQAEIDREKIEISIQQKIAELRGITNKTTFVHRVQFEHEFEAYREIWAAVIDAEMATKVLRAFDRDAKKDETFRIDKETKIENFKESFVPFFEKVQKYRPFVHFSVEKPLIKLAISFRSSFEHSNSYNEDKIGSKDFFLQQNQILSRVDTLILEIRDAIRERILILNDGDD